MNKKNILALIFTGLFLSACGNAPTNNANGPTNANTGTSPVQTLTVVQRPQGVKDKMAARGEQDEAKPILKIVEPKADTTIASSTVKVKLELSGDLKGYKPMMDEATHTGNHIHIILDNQPYEAYYNLDQEFELRNVADGDHTLRVFPSRPWHESFKNEGAFQIVKFKVKNGGGDTAKPATTSAGNTMANANANTATKPTPEGKDMPGTMAGEVDLKKPILSYSRPKGEYKGDDTNAVMIDFWLENAKLTGDGGEYRVRYSVDGGEQKFIEKWDPIWLTGWTAGKHTILLELVDKDGKLVDNGGYDSTTREITITK
ncbi:MAG: hypothetical protein ABI999_18700 [Acidobacteriota bacterium]